jgi:hypothetical protein
VDILRQSNLVKADDVIKAVHSAVKQARKALDAAQSRQKAYADTFRRDLLFQVGDLVLLSTKNLKLKVRQDTKLLPKYVGPVTIVKKVGRVAYKLDLPPQWRVHDVFHVSLLKRFVARGEQGFVAAPPVDWLSIDDPLYEVEAILDHDDSTLRGKPLKRYLVKWEGYDHLHNSWERETNLVNCDEVLEAYWRHASTQPSARSRKSKP